MSDDDDEYQVQNIHRYVRKSYKKNNKRENEMDCFKQDLFSGQSGGCCDAKLNDPSKSPRVLLDEESDLRGAKPRPPQGCSCYRGPETDGEIINILHKKCPVINLAQQQLVRIINETEHLLSDSQTKSIYNFLCKCKEVLRDGNPKMQVTLLVLIVLAFLAGVFFGAATCSSFPGRFDSPILVCVESYLNRKYRDEFRSIT
ncbi:uncharacterized protein LOC105397970 [Plutella xylostella]|uniref:uncharacterized protein LOC105397970 n=1 Tax=Plutella xylostella TaxID=51655 RepID=UPI002032D83E|nr:uncharacterized protein LOC105397970 [Plutella xylostella]